MKNSNRLLCSEANQIDIVEFLGRLGFRPTRARGKDYWYLSPLRVEKSASFKVNKEKNVWYDHGTGKGGTLVDLALRFYNCSVAECLLKIQNLDILPVSFQQQATSSAFEKEKHDLTAGRIRITNSVELTDQRLINYLQARKIDLTIAKKYCSEVSFELYNRQHKALGFRNNAGGYELRSADFKGSSSPKQPRLITSPDANSVAVFEGIFSFLSYQTLTQSKQIKDTSLPDFQEDYLVLNSIAFFGKARSTMENYSIINLYLDQDKMGIAATEKALKWSDKYKDRSQLYAGFKDLNDYLIDSSKPGLKQSRRQGRRL